MIDFSNITGSQDPIISAYRSLDVERYHTQADVPAQTLADHSARVALLVMKIWPDARPQVTQYALIHDIGEKITGDLPYTTKLILAPEALDQIDALEADYVQNFLGINIEISENEKMMVKVCDYLELMLYCLQFKSRGALQIAAKGAELVWNYGTKLKELEKRELHFALKNHFLEDIHKADEHVGNTLRNSLRLLRSEFAA